MFKKIRVIFVYDIELSIVCVKFPVFYCYFCKNQSFFHLITEKDRKKHSSKINISLLSNFETYIQRMINKFDEYRAKIKRSESIFDV